MSYELILAQSLSATLGNTIVRYNTTIGLYIMALGLGVIFYNKYLRSHCLIGLIRTEQSLAIIGALCPIIVIFVNYFLNQAVQSVESTFMKSSFSYLELVLDYGLIFIIGLLSGFELPMLMDLGKKYFGQANMTVFAIDYFGSTAGALLFALYLLPNYGIFALALFIGCINGFTAILLYILLRKHLNKKGLSLLPFICIITATLTVLAIYNIEVENFIVNNFYI